MHAVAGLLKLYLRELPTNVLTTERREEFVKVTEMDDKATKIKALNELVHSLPIENFELLRALSGHLLRIVENSDVNKMTIRNGMLKSYMRVCHLWSANVLIMQLVSCFLRHSTSLPRFSPCSSTSTATSLYAPRSNTPRSMSPHNHPPARPTTIDPRSLARCSNPRNHPSNNSSSKLNSNPSNNPPLSSNSSNS